MPPPPSGSEGAFRTEQGFAAREEKFFARETSPRRSRSRSIHHTFISSRQNSGIQPVSWQLVSRVTVYSLLITVNSQQSTRHVFTAQQRSSARITPKIRKSVRVSVPKVSPLYYIILYILRYSKIDVRRANCARTQEKSRCVVSRFRRKLRGTTGHRLLGTQRSQMRRCCVWQHGSGSAYLHLQSLWIGFIG